MLTGSGACVVPEPSNVTKLCRIYKHNDRSEETKEETYWRKPRRKKERVTEQKATGFNVISDFWLLA